MLLFVKCIVFRTLDEASVKPRASGQALLLGLASTEEAATWFLGGGKIEYPNVLEFT